MMKIFLIRVGKAWKTLRYEGFLRGGRRIILAFLALFKRVRPGDILFVTGGVADSARYRTEHVAEELSFQGFRSSVTVQDNPFLVSYADAFSIFVFHRVLFTPSVAKLIEKAKALGKEIIFETDDLVYDKAFLEHMDYFQKMNAFEKKLYENGVGGEILADPLVKVCTTSTSFLAEKLRERGKQVFIVRNKVSKEDALWAEGIVGKKVDEGKEVKISYLSGTPSHDKDFATITGALLVLFEKYPQMRLVLAGPLDTGSTLNRFQDRILRVPFLPRKEYFATVADMDINLAPLEIGNPFCESKSELKWFEAGLLAVPTVASATGTFKEAITDGIDGYVAETTEEWVAKLSYLIENTDMRKQMGEQARKTVLEKYVTSEAHNQEYYNYLRSRISNLKSIEIKSSLPSVLMSELEKYYHLAFFIMPFRRNQDVVRIIVEQKEDRFICALVDGWHNEEVIPGNKEGREVADFVSIRFPEVFFSLKDLDEKERAIKATRLMDKEVLDQWPVHASCVGAFLFHSEAREILVTVGSVSIFVYRNNRWEKPLEIDDHSLDPSKYPSDVSRFFGRGELKGDSIYSAKPDVMIFPDPLPLVITSDGVDKLFSEEDFKGLLEGCGHHISSESMMKKIVEEIERKKEGQKDDISVVVRIP